MNQPRSHYQRHDGNMTLRRQRHCTVTQFDALATIAEAAKRAKEATTQAAYDLRVQTLKRYIKSL